MTDARLRGEWLRKMQFEDLSDEAWRVFTLALMWSNESGTDGRIPKRQLHRLYPSGLTSDEALAELVDAGLLVLDGSGNATMPDWDGALGQSLAEVVEQQRAHARERAKRSRQRSASARRTTDGVQNRVSFDEGERAHDVTRDVPEHVRGHVGPGPGSGQGSLVKGENFKKGDDPSLPEKVFDDWPTRQPGAGFVKCAVPDCDSNVCDLPATNGGVCSMHGELEAAPWRRRVA